MIAFVEVNECRIWAVARGAEWWNLFRIRSGPRVTTVTTSIAGDLVHVACDSKEDAEWLTAHMVGEGIPKSAAVVKTSRPAPSLPEEVQ